MGILQFFFIVAICCLGAAFVTWALKKWTTDTPAFVYWVIWAMACFVIIVTALYAVGGLPLHDPQIPSLRR